MEKEESKSYSIVGENDFDFSRLLWKLLSKWYWVLLSVVLCVAASYVYMKTIQPAYRKYAVVLVKTNDKDPFSDILGMSGQFSNGKSVGNELFVFKTRMLMEKVAEELRLDVSYAVGGILRDTPLFDDKPFTVNFLDKETQQASLTIKPIDKLNYLIVSCNGAACRVEAQYGQTVETAAGRIVVNPESASERKFTGHEVKVRKMPVEETAANYANKIETALVGKETTLIRLTCTDVVPGRAAAILTSLIKAYNKSILDDRGSMARNTAEFIDERLVIISQELQQVEDQLTRFKQNNNIMDLSSTASQYLTESAKARTDIISVETEKSVATSIKEYLLRSENADQLIPNIAGLSNSTLQADIENYNNLMLQRNKLEKNSGEKNIVVQNLSDNLEAMRKIMIGAIDNYISTLNVRLSMANRVEQQLMNSIKSVPEQEKTALSIMRQQGIKEALYTFLLQKREENALQLSSTETNIRVVEKPMGGDVPVAPAGVKYIFFGLVIGLVIPTGIIALCVFLEHGVQGRKDVENFTTLPIIGEIPKSDKECAGSSEVVVSESDNSLIAEAFRLLRSNMMFIAKDAKVLMFVSTIPGEGKTFISKNLAITLALSGKKVVILDTDLRRRTQSRLLNCLGNNGLSTYLAGQADDVSALIVKSRLEGVGFIPAGPIPPNPSELLMSERLDLLMQELRDEYDYIVIDNVPAQAVADAFVVNRFVDVTIYVIRDGLLDRRALPDIERLYKENKFHNMCVVINGCDLKKKGYGYGYYGYYGYGYGYVGRGKKRRSGLRRMLKELFAHRSDDKHKG